MEPQTKKEEFLKEFEALLKKHNAEICITPYGCNGAKVDVDLYIDDVGYEIFNNAYSIIDLDHNEISSQLEHNHGIIL